MKHTPGSERVAEAYLAFVTNSWSHDYLTALIRRDPDEAWETIVRLIELAPEGEALASVAAGPLEDFLVSHGEQFLEAISAHARTSPKIRHALGGVWGESQMPKKVWKQIQKLAGSP